MLANKADHAAQLQHQTVQCMGRIVRSQVLAGSILFTGSQATRLEFYCLAGFRRLSGIVIVGEEEGQENRNRWDRRKVSYWARLADGWRGA